MSHAIKPFTTDGCSGGMSWFWKKVFKKPPPWEGECIKHDVRYWIGGSRKDRLRADLVLYRAIKKQGNIILALVTFTVIRIFGNPYLPTPFRWGYGHGYMKRTYAELNEFERDALKILCSERGIDITV